MNISAYTNKELEMQSEEAKEILLDLNTNTEITGRGIYFLLNGEKVLPQSIN
jgi:hypothetical protein